MENDIRSWITLVEAGEHTTPKPEPMIQISIGYHRRAGFWVVTYNGNRLGDDRSYPTAEAAWAEAEKRVDKNPHLYELANPDYNRFVDP